MSARLFPDLVMLRAVVQATPLRCSLNVKIIRVARQIRRLESIELVSVGSYNLSTSDLPFCCFFLEMHMSDRYG
ncbi:hypothetical protein EV421DRAFT_1854060 [Armillaria borealis]|uniref:Uncharacterized protein n=1 Tax=Armillaria borealis TaxID=47425 RepID=A0AA39IVR8_9AGAR|nr:hypothetical protein EV421DRAFT_1854060 [Armillaria borealis]